MSCDGHMTSECLFSPLLPDTLDDDDEVLWALAEQVSTSLSHLLAMWPLLFHTLPSAGGEGLCGAGWWTRMGSYSAGEMDQQDSSPAVHETIFLSLSLSLHSLLSRVWLQWRRRWLGTRLWRPFARLLSNTQVPRWRTTSSQ